MRTKLTIILLFLISAAAFPQITVKAVGDIMPGSITPNRILPPDSGRVFVDSIALYLAGADITIGNFEGSLVTTGMFPSKCSDESRKAGRCFEFGVPEYLAAIFPLLNFSVLHFDNNHCFDYGEQGFQFTQQIFEGLGIKMLPPRTSVTLDVNERKIAIVPFSFLPRSYHVSDLKTAASVVSILAETHDIVIVTFHAGCEGVTARHTRSVSESCYNEDRGNVVKFAHTVIEAGADLVIGHGPHVLRAVELYKEKLIAYSLGNFLTYGNFSIKGMIGQNVILEAVLDDSTGNFISAKLIPIVQIAPGIPTIDITNEPIEQIRSLTESDFPETQLEFIDDCIFPVKPDTLQTK